MASEVRDIIKAAILVSKDLQRKEPALSIGAFDWCCETEPGKTGLIGFDPDIDTIISFHMRFRFCIAANNHDFNVIFKTSRPFSFSCIKIEESNHPREVRNRSETGQKQTIQTILRRLCFHRDSCLILSHLELKKKNEDM